jgi:hypothetical protein
VSHPKRVGDLDIDQDLGFQRAEWRVQRGGWIAMLAIILAALAGAFGRGPLAAASAGSESAGLVVDYDRLLRKQAASQLEIRLPAASLAGNEARILIDSTLLSAITIERMAPEPEREEAAPNGVIYTFRLSQTGAPQRILVEYQATAPWRHRGFVSLPEHPPVYLSLFVYP